MTQVAFEPESRAHLAFMLDVHANNIGVLRGVGLSVYVVVVMVMVMALCECLVTSSGDPFTPGRYTLNTKGISITA